jgi:hypothetical protein
VEDTINPSDDHKIVERPFGKCCWCCCRRDMEPPRQDFAGVDSVRQCQSKLLKVPSI